MTILSVGSLNGISNTCKFRSIALSKIANEVDEVNVPSFGQSRGRVCNKLFNLGLSVKLPDKFNTNKKIIDMAQKKKYDIVWIDKGLTINANTLKAIKQIQPNTVIVSYSPDNMALRHNQSQNFLDCIPLYDVHITTKSYIIDDLKKLGAKDVLFVNQSYEQTFHYPREVSEEDVERIGGDVGFVGAWEQERMDSILYLTRNGIKVRVFGTKDWQRCKNDNPNLTT